MQKELVYAGFGRRLAAYLFDGLVISILGLAISFLLGTNPFSDQVQTDPEIIDRLLTIGAAMLYYLLFWVNYDGATPGKKMMGIQIVRVDGVKVNYPTAIIRYIGMWVSAVAALLGFLWMLWDKRKQTWHDKMAGTAVVIVKEKIARGLVFFVTVGSLLAAVAVGVGPVAYQKTQLMTAGKQNIEMITEYNTDWNNLQEETRNSIILSREKLDKAGELSQKANLTPEEKTEATLLIAEAIKQAKLATELEPENPVVWVGLGDTYKMLIKSVDGAEVWAVDSFKRAITLSPKNYLYHEKLGGVYFAAGKYQQAIEEFRIVTEMNPNYPNGYYNLGVAFKEFGAKSSAKTALEKALDLLPGDSPNRYKIEKELEML